MAFIVNLKRTLGMDLFSLAPLLCLLVLSIGSATARKEYLIAYDCCQVVGIRRSSAHG